MKCQDDAQPETSAGVLVSTETSTPVVHKAKKELTQEERALFKQFAKLMNRREVRSTTQSYNTSSNKFMPNQTDEITDDSDDEPRPLERQKSFQILPLHVTRENLERATRQLEFASTGCKRRRSVYKPQIVMNKPGRRRLLPANKLAKNNDDSENQMSDNEIKWNRKRPAVWNPQAPMKPKVSQEFKVPFIYRCTCTWVTASTRHMCQKYRIYQKPSVPTHKKRHVKLLRCYKCNLFFTDRDEFERHVNICRIMRRRKY